MKYLIVILVLISSNVFAVQLVCLGDRTQMQNQRVVNVDCANRKAVIDMLGAAWSQLRKQGIGGDMENMCYDPYKRAREMHPSISFEQGIAESFFYQCNIALEYIK